MDINQVLTSEYCNGFGFEYDRPYLILGYLYPNNGKLNEYSLQSQIKTNFSGLNIKIEDNYIKIHWSNYSLIPKIINYCLDQSINIKLSNKPGPIFKPGDHFSLKNMEQNIIESTLKLIGQKGSIKMTINPVLLYHWNWTTQSGKNFCSELRSILGKSPIVKCISRYSWPGFDEVCRNYQILHRGSWSRYRPSNATLYDEIILDESEVEEETCVVCLDNYPDTLVLPCMHVVVCRSCSEKLKNSKHSDLCVYCRQPIKEVLIDHN